MTNQPKWKFIKNLGDVSPVEYGGYFVFEDETGVYAPEAEYWDSETRELFRFSLDQLALVDGHLVSKGIYDKVLFGGPEALPYLLKDYVEWFDKDIDSIASFEGIEPDELRRAFCSDKLLDRAYAYRNVGEYWGFSNLDNYTVKLTAKEAEKRFKDWE